LHAAFLGQWELWANQSTSLESPNFSCTYLTRSLSITTPKFKKDGKKPKRIPVASAIVIHAPTAALKPTASEASFPAASLGAGSEFVPSRAAPPTTEVVPSALPNSDAEAVGTEPTSPSIVGLSEATITPEPFAHVDDNLTKVAMTEPDTPIDELDSAPEKEPNATPSNDRMIVCDADTEPSHSATPSAEEKESEQPQEEEEDVRPAYCSSE